MAEQPHQAVHDREQGGRQGRIKGHPKGLGKNEGSLQGGGASPAIVYPKGWARTERACQGGGASPAIVYPKGLGGPRMWQLRFAPLPHSDPSQALGGQALSVLAQPLGAGTLHSCPALWGALLSCPACPPVWLHL